MENFAALQNDLLVTSCSNLINIWDGLTYTHLGTFSGHTSEVHCVNFSMDNTKLASVGADLVGIVWRIENLAEIARVILSNSPISVCFSNSGEELITSDTEEITVWDYRTQKTLRTIRNDRWRSDCQAYLSSDNSIIVSPSYEGNRFRDQGQTILKCWDYVTCEQRSSIEFTLVITQIAVSPSDGMEIAVGFKDGKLEIWDMSSCVVKYEGKHHKREITALHYHSSGIKLCSSSLECKIVILNTVNGEKSIVSMAAVIHTISLNPDETTIAVRCGKVVRIVNAFTGKIIRVIESKHGDCMCWSNRTQSILW
jgi:WD40 repeat protein